MPLNIPPDGEFINVAEGQQIDIEIPPAGVGWAGAVYGFADAPIYKQKMAKMPPKSTLPPLELNLAAKKPSPWVKLNTPAEILAARKQGKLIRYLLGHSEYDPMELLVPSRKYTIGTLKSYLVRGVVAHTTERVYVHAPVKTDTVVWVWMGKCREEYDELLVQGTFKSLPYSDLDFGVLNEGEKVQGLVYV